MLDNPIPCTIIVLKETIIFTTVKKRGAAFCVRSAYEKRLPVYEVRSIQGTGRTTALKTMDLLTCIRCISKAYDGVLKKICAGFGLTLLEVKVVSFLHNNPKMNTAGDISEYRLLSKGNVSHAVESLIRQGLLERVPDRSDRRKVRLYLLPAAKPVTDRIDFEWEKFDKRLLERFEEKEILQFDLFKEKLMQNAKAIMDSVGE